MALKKESSKLYRSKTNRIIAGVCGGIGEYLNIDPLILRVVLVVITLFGGSGILIYIIAWIFIPSEKGINKTGEDYIKDNVEEMKLKSQELAGKDPKVIWGIILIVFGLSLLLNNLGFYYFDFVKKLWPLIIIFLGILFLNKKD